MLHTKADLEKQADIIMNQFNFEKVHAHMTKEGWKWYMGEPENRVPTIEEIKVQARVLLNKAIWDDRNVTDCGTGGLTAVKMPYGLRLYFSIASS